MTPMMQTAVAPVLPKTVRTRPETAKAALKVPNAIRKHAQWLVDAGLCRDAIRLSRMEPKAVAAELGLSPSQLSDQLAANERPQTERFRASDLLRGPWLVAEAEYYQEFDVVRTIVVRLK